MEENRRQILLTRRTPRAEALVPGLSGLGYEPLFVPEELSLWDESALSRFAREHPLLRAVVHPDPQFISKPLEKVTREDFAEQRRQGPLSAFAVTRAFSEYFRLKHAGSIIYLSSVHAEKPAGHGALYSMVCGAEQMLCREANQEYGPDGVRYFFLQLPPEDTDTDRRSPVSNYYFAPEKRAPQKHLTSPEELLGVLAFLLTPAAAPLSGQDLCLDGGLTQFYTARPPREEGGPWKNA